MRIGLVGIGLRLRADRASRDRHRRAAASRIVIVALSMSWRYDAITSRGGSNAMSANSGGPSSSLAAWLCHVARSASAQDWPTRPVRIIIPLGPGGGGDVFTRLLAEELQKRFGQPFVVENRPGGGLNIGTRACAEAAPDGYTLLRPVGRAGRLQPVHLQEPAVQSGEGFRAGHQPVHQRQRAGRQRQARRQDHPRAGRARQSQARHAELRHVLVHAGVFHGQAEQEATASTSCGCRSAAATRWSTR